MDSTNDHSVDPCYRLLALCARADPHPFMDEQLAGCIEGFTAWNDLPEQAELHGMGPLLWHHIRRLGVAIPHETKKILSGLYLRQRVFQQAQVQVLLEIISLLERHDIHAVLLKGLSLAYEYYPDPTLRPSSDIDLLLKKEDIPPALSLLEKNGYKIPVLTDVDLQSEWIVESALQNGLSVRIELHHLSDDEFIGFDSAPRKLQINGEMIYVLHFMDHLDYLIRHLTRHLFVATTTKPLPLKWIADIVSVVERHAQEIDWEKQAGLLNRLEMIYSLTPFPGYLSGMIPIKQKSPPKGVNVYPQGWPQQVFWEWKQAGLLNYIKQILSSPVYIRHTLAAPSPWWLQVQYGINQKSVFLYGQIVYRFQIFRMLMTRFMRRK